jgi:phytanoyl-CoA hydroxylase
MVLPVDMEGHPMNAATESAPAKPDAPSLAAQFCRDGYVVLPESLTAEEVDRLNAAALRLCRGQLGTVPGGTVVDDAERDDDVLRRFLCIHFPHKLSPEIFEQMRHPRIVQALHAVLGPNIKSMQSMLFIKAEGKPGQAWHQDEFFIPTRDRSLTAAWTALDDATVENGCLWVLPGSHAPGIIYPSREHDDPDYDCTAVSYDFPYDEEEAVPLEVPAGSTVLFNGYLLHKSFPHRGHGGYRRALVTHYMRAESLLPWFLPGPEVEHMGLHDHRDIVLISGVDPYAYKGTREIARAYVRPDREGGCDR